MIRKAAHAFLVVKKNQIGNKRKGKNILKKIKKGDIRSKKQ